MSMLSRSVRMYRVVFWGAIMLVVAAIFLVIAFVMWPLSSNEPKSIKPLPP